ncbi:DUF4350 domain-containing protein [Demequina sp.]|uniref:DUF4350 domain-containing protein n=1 Tax=Demequina sp. TaxID=2050685 RepID=UPI003D0EDE0E
MTTSVYTAPGKTESIGSRASRSRWWLIGIGMVVVLIAIVALTSRPTDYRDLSIENSTDNGSRAVAQILGDQGVSLRQFDALGRVFVAEPSTTTLVIAGAEYLTDAQVASILKYDGDILFIGASSSLMDALDPAIAVSYEFLPETVDAACADPDAVAAERARVEYTGLQAVDDTDAELCFLNRSDVAGMAVITAGDHTRTVVTNPRIYQNEFLLNDGNAALALRTAGHHENVAWYIADGYDSTLLGGGGEAPTSVENLPDFLPPGFGTAVYALGLAALVAALWRGRRFGPLAVEPLPVVVSASEATRGRARLYRRARAYGRATAALRAAAARRIGVRLGVPRTTEREGMVAAIERVTTRSPQEIARILYGPAPTSEAQMLDIVNQLDALEGEVHTS